MIQDFKKGDEVTITLEGRSIDAVIVLASANGISLAVGFDGFLGGYVQFMPLLYDQNEKAYVDLVQKRTVKLTRIINPTDN